MTEPTAYEQQAPPVCPRHPERVSYVRCQRCGRPTCPECQRDAPVGVQCVDCVRAQAATMRPASTVFGGRVTDRPLVSLVVIGLCVLVWLGQQGVAGLTSRIWFVPVLGADEPWRFITSAFAHSPTQIMHIVFNMLALWLVGAQYLEPLLGRLRFAALYLLSAVGGSVGYLLLSRPPTLAELGAGTDPGHWFTGALGASGAVFGLFGALLVLNRKLGRSSAGMYVTVLINAVIGFLIPNIAWQAHLGGFVTGAAVAGVLAYAGRERRRWQWPGIALVAVVLLLATVVKYAVAPDLR